MTKEQHKIAIEVIEQVNKYFETDCRVKSRKTNIARPRMYACKIIKELTKSTLQDIGSLFNECWKGKKTHDNVLHAIKVVNNDLEVMPKYKMYYLELRAIVESTDVYKDSSLAKKSIISDIRQEVYNALMSKDMTELQQILKTIK
jgi:chromosomal replication initiation ATPase DnaA